MHASLQVVDADAFIDERIQESIANPESADQRDFRRGMALLALMAPSDDATEVLREDWEHVAAFYASDQDRITILDRGRALDGPGAAFLLLHEIVHAMQHVEIDLDDDRHHPTRENSLAFSGKIEGEAVLYQDLGKLEAYGRDPDDTDWVGVFQQFEDREWKGARGDASPYESAWHRFSYAFGGDYVNRAWRAGGNAAVRDLFADLPSSTRQILSGYGAVAPGSLPWTEDPDEVGMPVLPAEFEHAAIVHVGTWLFEIWKDLWNADSRHSALFSDTGFAGDVLNVFRLPASGDVIAFWRLRFASPERSGALLASLRSDSFLTMVADGKDIVVVADTRGAPPVSFLDTLAWRAVTPEDFAAPANQAAGLRKTGTVLCGQALPRDER